MAPWPTSWNWPTASGAASASTSTRSRSRVTCAKWATAPPSCPSFANVSALSTDDGLVLVDTGSAPLARMVHGKVREWSPDRLNTAVYSHGHIDHVFGVPVYEEEAADKGWPRPHVVAHEALPARFDRYILTAGYNGIINQRQFQMPNLSGPRPTAIPTRPTATCSPSTWAAPRSSCTTAAVRPTTTPGRGCPTARCCAAATCSSGRRPTPATRRRCSATRRTGPTACARWSPWAPR